MIEEGTYAARALTGALGYTNGGKEQVAVQFALLDEQGAETGERITWYGYFTEKTQERTLRALRTAGWAGTDISQLDGLGSRDVELVVKHEEYNGKWAAKVAWVNEPGSGGLALSEPMPADKAKAFANRIKGDVVALDRANGGKAQDKKKPSPRTNARPGNPDEAPPPTDRDDPFA